MQQKYEDNNRSDPKHESIQDFPEWRLTDKERKKISNSLPYENNNFTRNRGDNKLDVIDQCNKNKEDCCNNLKTENKSESIISININFDDVVNSIIHLGKTNKEFYTLQILFFLWMLFIIIQLTYGYTESLNYVISDSFFNFFKIFAFLISGIAIYFNRYFNYKYKIIHERFELLAALSNLVFLIIVSFIMFISALHLITEDGHKDYLHSSSGLGHDHESYTISVFKFFYLIKILLHIIALIAFSDYIIHPFLEMKINYFKKNKIWISELNELPLFELNDSSKIIKRWNNHFENINCMIINVLTDLISSMAFLISFHFSNDNHFEYIYFFISCMNLVVVLLFVRCVFPEIINSLMQTKPSIVSSIDSIIQREIGLYEGCIGIKEIKYWEIAKNKVKGKK